jgi:hypothetical protein
MEKKQSNKKEKIDYTLAGQKLFSLLWNTTTDGLLITLPGFGLGDVHLLIMEKDDRVSWHITDNRKTEKTEIYPYGGHLPKEEFYKRILNSMIKYIKKYHGNKCAWIMKEPLESCVNEELKKLDDNPNEFPIEILKMVVDCNFEDIDRWKKIQIKNMISKKILMAYTIDNGVVRLVIPLNNKKALFMSERQTYNFQDEFFKIIGVDEYFNYIKNRTSEKKSERYNTKKE